MTENETTHTQILKTREDHEPVRLQASRMEDGWSFKLDQGSSCSWATAGTTINAETLRKRIEPWLTALCQSEHLSILVGSGLTHAVHQMATGQLLPGMGSADFDGNEFEERILAEAKRSAEAVDRSEGNIEDQLRVALDLLRGLEILSSEEDAKSEKKRDKLRARLEDILEEFAKSILEGEQGISRAEEAQRSHAFEYLVTFLMSFASRTATRDRLHVFTTNYDRLIEAGADAAGLHLLDRFVGALSPVFRSSRLDLDLHYNPPGIRGEPRYLEGVARFTKLHGSIDWVETQKAIRRIGLPFGASEIAPFLNLGGLPSTDALQLMIYPNAGKDRETAGYPYVELFRDFAAASCRPNHTLFTYGYSFGDEHINRVIEDMLTIPSTHLVVMARDDSLGRIMQTYEKLGRPAQISLLIGDHLGDLGNLVDWYLPKPAIDRTSLRMSELLKVRHSIEQQPFAGASGENQTESDSSS